VDGEVSVAGGDCVAGGRFADHCAIYSIELSDKLKATNMTYKYSSAATGEEITRTWPVMQQLRPHLNADTYLQAVQRMMSDGYMLAAVMDDDGVVRGVAGYRIFEMLYCGKILYVDDLSVDESQRSKGYGGALIEWLMNRAREEGCAQIHLDSGVQREAAHKFYFREGFGINAYHFRRDV
jgi:GNAT superfamily N-acetyltransferase